MEYHTFSKQTGISSRCQLVSDDDRIWVGLALLVGIGLRGYFLAQPMRYDESFTFLNFVNRDLKYLFFYPLPNNHVLHSILIKASTLIWGEHPVSIRLIAFLAGIALIPAVYCLCRTLGQSGIFASIAIAVSPYFVLYSTNARGYTLLVLFALVLALIGIQIKKKPSIVRTLLFSLIAALGMLTMPSMLFPLAGIYLWVLLLLLINGHTKKDIFYTFAVLSVLITSTLTALFYTPVILVSNGIESIVANRFVKAQPWQDFVSHAYPHFKQTYNDFTRDIPVLLVLMTMLLVAFGIKNAIKQRNWPIVLVLPSIVLTSALIFVIKQKIPFERTWIYIIPFFILVADSGFTYLIAKVSDRIKLFLKIVTLGISIFIALSVMSKNAISTYQDTGVFDEAEIVVKYLKPIISDTDSLYIKAPANWPVYFYMWYHNVPQIKQGKHPESQNEYFIIMKSKYSFAKMTNKKYISLLDIGDLTLIQALGTDTH